MDFKILAFMVSFAIVLLCTEVAGVPPSGIAMCEGKKYGAAKCKSIGCCDYMDGNCMSKVGDEPCVGATVVSTGGPLDGPKGPTKPGKACKKKVTFPLKKSPVSKYPKFTTVFGVGVIANKVSDAKFQHVASTLAQLLDNDQDGCPDSPEVVTWLNKRKVVFWVGDGSEYADKPVYPDYDAVIKAGYKVGSALLWEQSVKPQCAGTKGTDACEDNTLEELLHVVTAEGYAEAFPKVLGTSPTPASNLTRAMDVARGGRFTKAPPQKYPASAWYTYTGDGSCLYGCQAVEYIYWAISSYMGANANIKANLGEWKLNTKAKLKAKDKLITAVIEDKTKYRLPTVAPNGVYKGCSKCSTGVHHGGK